MIEKSALVTRLWAKDPGLWKSDPGSQKEIVSRLGWLDAPQAMTARAGEFLSFAKTVRKEGFKTVLLLGMGGSSLAPEVFQKTFGAAKGYPSLRVLDSTDPERVRDIEKRIDLRRTLFIVSSKSGGTVELLSFFKYFFEKVSGLQGKRDAGRQFVAITDPGTPLERLAREKNFREIFLAPEDVGGRFSALTPFGLVPAALIGVNIRKVLDAALRFSKECLPSASLEKNSALNLGIEMAEAAQKGRDKLTLLTSKALESFGDWAEQLIAESTGKEGRGLVPVVGEPAGKIENYGRDRFFVALEAGFSRDSALSKKLAGLRKARHPVTAFKVKRREDLGAEFFRWEMATAVACAVLKINAFDQPDVQAAKDRTKALLKDVENGKSLVFPDSAVSLENFLHGVGEKDYFGILAFLPDRLPLRKTLTALARVLKDRTRRAVTLGFGPRYLHSTGQLHKGGPNTGVFFLLAAEHSDDLKIPGEKYTFAELELAQAIGDGQALASKGRRVFCERFPGASEKALEGFVERVRAVLCRIS
jgi:glucose-6-phosphate isomerase